MSVSFVQSVWTVMAMAVFIGIVIWAYSSHRKCDFDQAGRIAMDDDDKPGNMNSSNKIEE
jgi:cytochrome c oxidase cbb3-type subunit IV